MDKNYISPRDAYNDIFKSEEDVFSIESIQAKLEASNISNMMNTISKDANKNYVEPPKKDNYEYTKMILPPTKI